ncbi:hypothetical protein Tco_0577708 [Tanacetum coccineum]
MLKKFGLEDSKPMKTPMSSDTKLTKDEECESVDSTKYRGMIGTTHLGLWYPKGTGIETIVYADSDHAGDYVDRKSTSEDGQVRRIRHEEEIDILEYQVLTHEIKPTLKPLEEIIQENVFCLGGNWDHVPACLCYMLYYVDNYEKVHHLPIDGNANGRWITKQSGLIYPMRMPRKGSLAEEEVITHLLILCPLTNHLLLISNDDDDDVGNGRRSSACKHSFPHSLYEQRGGVKSIEKKSQKVVEKHEEFPAVKGWLDEDLDNYHLKELRCSTQCHTQMSMWIISRGVVLLILLMEYKVLRDFLLHRSSINNSARLSNKFGGFYFSFKFDISGLLHHVITTIAYRIRGGSLLALKCLVWFMKYYANVRRTVADFSHAPLNEYSPSPDDKKQWSLGCWFGGKLIQKLRQKGVYEESFSRHAAWIGGKLIQFMHTTMVPVQVKTMKIQAGIQVSRPRELTRQLQLWKCFGRLYFCCICT